MSENEKPNFDDARLTLAVTSESTAANDPMRAAEARMRRALGLEGDQLRSRAPQERIDPSSRPAERFSPQGHKRRFVHDGEVPVTLVHGLVPGRREHPDGNGTRAGTNAQPTNRLEVAEAALASEIANRERAERALAESQAAVHDLQTKLGHADLARQEAVEALRRERETVAALRASLQEAEDQVTETRQSREAAERALDDLRQREATLPEAPVEEVPRLRRGRKPRALSLAAAEPPAAAITPRKKPGRPRLAEQAPGREQKPIRWWLSARAKKKR